MLWSNSISKPDHMHCVRRKTICRIYGDSIILEHISVYFLKQSFCLSHLMQNLCIQFKISKNFIQKIGIDDVILGKKSFAEIFISKLRSESADRLLRIIGNGVVKNGYNMFMAPGQTQGESYSFLCIFDTSAQCNEGLSLNDTLHINSFFNL